MARTDPPYVEPTRKQSVPKALVVFICLVAVAGLIAPYIQRYYDQKHNNEKFAAQIKSNQAAIDRLNAQQGQIDENQNQISANQDRLIKLFASFLTCKTEEQCREILKKFIVLSVEAQQRQDGSSNGEPTGSPQSSGGRHSPGSSPSETARPRSTSRPEPSPEPSSSPSKNPGPVEVCVKVLQDRICVPRAELVGMSTRLGFSAAYTVALSTINAELNSAA